MRLFYSAYFRLVCGLLVPGLLAAQPQSTLVVAGLDGGSGQSCSYSILPNGTLWAWGANGSGELGDGTFTTRPLPVPLMAPSQWQSLGAGLQHAAAVRADGTLWAWGRNTSGQLGTGTTASSAVPPQQVGPDTNWDRVGAGAFFTVALRTDHTLWAWGTNSLGQVGDGTRTDRTAPVQIGAGRTWTSLAVGSSHTLALRSDGTLWAWGFNFSGELGVGTANDSRFQPTQVGTATNWAAISSGENHSAALRADGTLWTWGENLRGQLGTGAVSQQFTATPRQAGTATTWVAVAAGRDYTLAVRRDGTLWGWGLNNNGQLGNGTRTDSPSPVQGGTGTAWASVSAGALHAVASRLDGSVWAWGPNAMGQVGSAELTTLVVREPRQIGASQNWVKASAGNEQTLALRRDGTLWAWGSNRLGHLGNGSTTDEPRPVPVGTATTWTDVAVSNSHAAGLQADGSLWTWGDNYYGELGNGTTAPTALTTRPTQVGLGAAWGEVATGPFYTLALGRDGTLWGWGLNSSGQLGDGTQTNRPAPVPVPRPARAAPGTAWKHAAVGIDYTLALRSDNTLWGWGANGDGQLGDGGFTGRALPVQIGTDTTWLQIAAGTGHALAIQRDGSLWGWGSGTRGQVGNGPGNSNRLPQRIGTATGWARVAADAYNTAAVRADGTLWTWGGAANGQLGDGTSTNRPAPAQMGVATNWRQVEVSLGHSVAVRADGSLWAWGANPLSQLGIPAYTPTPLLVQFSSIALAAVSSRREQPLVAYPNPARTSIQLERGGADQPLVVVDLLGHEVRRAPVGATHLSVHGLAPGLYILRQGKQSTRLSVEE